VVLLLLPASGLHLRTTAARARDVPAGVMLHLNTSVAAVAR
jgi:hypothetical protein